jgi:hypothetical protein
MEDTEEVWLPHYEDNFLMYNDSPLSIFGVEGSKIFQSLCEFLPDSMPYPTRQ